MKNVADTANSYMRIRKTLGFEEYNWTDNGPFFLDMALSQRLYRKSVKQMVDKRLKMLPSATRKACRRSRNSPVCRPFSLGRVDSGLSPHYTDIRLTTATLPKAYELGAGCPS
jgi:hypothetical protein